MLICFLYYLSVLVVLGTSPPASVSRLVSGFLREVVVPHARNNWYQSIPGSSWDRVLIPRASVAVWRRSCVDLGAALGLFVRSGVDLKTACRLLEELIWRSRLFRKIFKGFEWS